MARKRMEDPSLKSWDEVNAALKLIRDNEIELELIEADMGKRSRTSRRRRRSRLCRTGMTSRSWSCRSRSL